MVCVGDERLAVEGIAADELRERHQQIRRKADAGYAHAWVGRRFRGQVRLVMMVVVVVMGEETMGMGVRMIMTMMVVMVPAIMAVPVIFVIGMDVRRHC